MSNSINEELTKRLEQEVKEFSQALRKHAIEQHQKARPDETCDANMTMEKWLVEALIDVFQHTVDKAVIEAKLYETNSTYDTLQEYLLDDWSSDDILTQLQLDLRKYRSDLTDEIKELKGEYN